MSRNDTYLVKTLVENWRREMEAAQLYQLSADAERDPRRKEILVRLAEVERRHAQMWEEKLAGLGVDTGALEVPRVTAPEGDGPQLLARIEAIEQGNGAWYQSLRNVIDDEDILGIIDQIDRDEAQHGDLDALLHSRQAAQRRLDKLWKSERHRQGTSDWLGDAIYGVNDGLGAIFGIIAGVAGYTANTHTVLISGFFGALASTLSMGAGAWLATRSENEVMETAIRQEREEIEQDPAHEVEELALLYQLKGFTPEESQRIAEQIAQDPDAMLKTMVLEEFGIHEANQGNPWKSALFGAVSTFIGGVIPLVPFFFMNGLPAMVAAAVVSILAHFAVGAAKSLITVRSWWASGLEMTLVGVIVGVVSYGLGELAARVFGVAAGG
ncbi:VIT1/CCC1 transporter family protein [Alicyclobacillus macrosporangiidus]|uniref:TIGR00267 family protein n=1 Tax=Alicyclobacillus macrosporangiidus TaxID=392015 RepID=A0A1I7KIN5_9BACL|nr:VIT1/CCC1 transporter family protein [Alicyclobacillus macrosporangiidus]SFU97246.1 TIGR00267 family protein [Alicyclobacillus macrosporangiidus]